MNSAALDLVDDTVRVDGFADIDGERQFADANVFADLDLGDRGTIGAGVLVAREADAVSDTVLFGWLPVGAAGSRLNHVL